MKFDNLARTESLPAFLYNEDTSTVMAGNDTL